VTTRRRKRKQLLDDLKEKRRCCKLKEEELVRSLCGTSLEVVDLVRQTTRMNGQDVKGTGGWGGGFVDWTVALYRAKPQAILDSVINFLFPQKVKNLFPPYIPVFTRISAAKQPELQQLPHPERTRAFPLLASQCL
jgi:hypothetical protein